MKKMSKKLEGIDISRLSKKEYTVIARKGSSILAIKPIMWGVELVTWDTCTRGFRHWGHYYTDFETMENIHELYKDALEDLCSRNKREDGVLITYENTGK